MITRICMLYVSYHSCRHIYICCIRNFYYYFWVSYIVANNYRYHGHAKIVFIDFVSLLCVCVLFVVVIVMVIANVYIGLAKFCKSRYFQWCYDNGCDCLSDSSSNVNILNRYTLPCHLFH